MWYRVVATHPGRGTRDHHRAVRGASPPLPTRLATKRHENRPAHGGVDGVGSTTAQDLASALARKGVKTTWDPERFVLADPPTGTGRSRGAFKPPHNIGAFVNYSMVSVNDLDRKCQKGSPLNLDIDVNAGNNPPAGLV